MKGLELSRRFFEECGRPVLERDFADVMPLLAAGLFGSGSECLGYDDGVSPDHDFEPGFCIFLPDESIVDRRTAFLLERAYAKLPKEFLGFKRSLLSPVGGSRHGVVRAADFFTSCVGSPDGALSLTKWLTVPEQALLEATCGEVFFDGAGEVTRIRNALAAFPEDVRRKKLAGKLLLAAQAGQYNYPRCIKRGETAASQLSAIEFVKSAVSAAFLINGRYEPYYKWTFRALRELPELSELSAPLEMLISTGNGEDTYIKKYDVIEQISASLISAVTGKGFSTASSEDLERHAYSVNDGIADAFLRNLHILAGV